MQAGGPVKWKDVKAKPQKRVWRKNALYFFFSFLITGIALFLVILFHKLENKQIVKEIKTHQTNFKNGKPRFQFLKSISTYDTLGRLVKTIEFNALKSEIFESENKYDSHGRLTDSLISHNNPENDTVVTHVHFEYTGNRLSKKIFDSLHFILYKYNLDGHLGREEEYQKIRGKKQFCIVHSIHYIYYKKDRLSQTDDSISPIKHEITNYSYNADGRINEVTEGKNEIIFSYIKSNDKSKELHKADGKPIYKLDFDYEYYLKP